MGKYSVVGTMAALLILAGCGDEGSDERLINIAVEQEKQKEEIDTASRKIEGFERRLVEIKESLAKIPPPTGAAEPGKTTETETSGPKVVEFKDAPEYGQIVAQISAIQQKLNLTESRLVQTERNIAREQEQARLRDPAQAWQAMNNPQELGDRLTRLAQNFSPRIEDAARRQQFEMEVEQLKQNLSYTPSTQELYQRVVSDLTERLNNEQNDRAREFIERQMQSLQAASAEELEGRLERYRRFESFRQLRELQQKYDIPRETYRDAGLPSMGRERRAPQGGDRRGPGGRRPGGG